MSARQPTNDEMVRGLGRAILQTLSFHRGRGRALSREGLVGMCARCGFAASERVVREEIKSLRRAGHLICSAAGEEGGYYMAEDLGEFEAFALLEFRGKIADMSETLRAMERAARERFGDGAQLGLF